MLVTSFDFVLHSDILFKSSCLRLTCRNATRRRLQCGRGDIPTGLHHDNSGHHPRSNPILVAKLFSGNRIHPLRTPECLFGTSGQSFIRQFCWDALYHPESDMLTTLSAKSERCCSYRTWLSKYWVSSPSDPKINAGASDVAAYARGQPNSPTVSSVPF
jgi:hypothetical protein